MNETFLHLCAYYENVGAGEVNNSLTAVTDNILTKTTSNNFILPQPGKLRLAYGAGAAITRLRINTPSLRYVGLPYVGPLNGALVVPSPANLTDYSEFGPTFPVADEIAAEATNPSGGADVEFALLWFAFGMRPTPGGPKYRIRFTASITASAGTWQSGSLTPDQTLPAGRYAIVGMQCVGANLAAGRLIFPGGGWRPGVLAQDTIYRLAPDVFVNGDLGVLGTFDSVNIPNLEVFSTGANSSQEVFLDLIRIGSR